jgi:hypothetical protein
MATKKRTMAAEELDLVPIMNLVTILIPFLLMASEFVTLAAIDSTLPAIGAPTPPDSEEDESLGLSVIVTDEGYTVAGNDATLKSPGDDEEEDSGPTIPCGKPGCPTASSYDIDELSRMLRDIKDRWPDEENVILVPESDIKYEVLINTMDATRKDKTGDLFPFVVIAGGAG